MSWLAWPWYFICKVNSTNRVLLLKNTLCTLCLRGWGFHAIPFFNCNILQGAISDSWRRCTCTNVLLVCKGEVGELVQPAGMWGLPWGLLCGTSAVLERICVWWLVIIVIFMGFGQAGANRCRGCLKVISWEWWFKSQKGGPFHREDRFSLCNTAVLWNFLGIYCKRFYWIPLFTILLLFYMFEVGKAKSATQSDRMMLILNGIF